MRGQRKRRRKDFRGIYEAISLYTEVIHFTRLSQNTALTHDEYCGMDLIIVGISGSTHRGRSGSGRVEVTWGPAQNLGGGTARPHVLPYRNAIGRHLVNSPPRYMFVFLSRRTVITLI